MKLITILLAIFAVLVAATPAPAPQVKAEGEGAEIEIDFLGEYCKPIESCNITEADLKGSTGQEDIAAPPPISVICVACSIAWDKCQIRNKNNNPWQACHNELCRNADCRRCGFWDCHNWGWRKE
ncbi:hypothetical protein BDV96DRAFT_650736 [Lophiotrema nucula]|uniref:Uncharacterized protein n=1 Tax=Lophiotrema nucula TaxID=690887 RepID=A0A6A5YUP8_9PLEO|nr:hypothetical protein BDV96DRAFT_650736 [Lophiotrema nucula]